jgi:hypothetical protein
MSRTFFTSVAAVLRPCPAKEGSFGRGRGSLFYVKTLGLDFQHLSGRPTCL